MQPSERLVRGNLLEIICIQWSYIIKNSYLLLYSIKKYIEIKEITIYLWCEATLNLFITIRRSYNIYLELNSM